MSQRRPGVGEGEGGGGGSLALRSAARLVITAGLVLASSNDLGSIPEWLPHHITITVLQANVSKVTKKFSSRCRRKLTSILDRHVFKMSSFLYPEESVNSFPCIQILGAVIFIYVLLAAATVMDGSTGSKMAAAVLPWLWPVLGTPGIR